LHLAHELVDVTPREALEKHLVYVGELADEKVAGPKIFGPEGAHDEQTGGVRAWRRITQ
jgi:hypothetical protein